MSYLLARIKEPSTWAALVSFLAVFHVQLTADQASALVQALAGIGAAIAVFLPEGPKK